MATYGFLVQDLYNDNRELQHRTHFAKGPPNKQDRRKLKKSEERMKITFDFLCELHFKMFTRTEKNNTLDNGYVNLGLNRK